MTSSFQSCRRVRPIRLPPVILAFLLVVSLVASDPIERASAPVLLLDIALPPMTAKHYMDTFWHDANFYKDFLKESGDRDVDIQPWSPAPASPSSSNNKDHKHTKTQQQRTVVTKHPVKTRMPGIPSHVKSTKTQTLFEEEGGEGGGKKHLHLIKVHETNVVEGVPFADRFYVVLVWTATWGEETASGSGSSSSSSKHSHHWGRRDSKADSSKTTVRLTVHQHVVFKRPFWVEKVVEKDAASETLFTLTLWRLLAYKRMDVPVDGKSPAPFATPTEEEGGTTTKSECRLVSVAKHVLLTGFLTSVVVLVTKGAAYVPGLVRSGGQSKNV